MSRSLHKSWQDKRPGFTRRVRWLEANETYARETFSSRIRLCFEDPDGLINVYFDSPEEAQGMYDRFREGLVNVRELMR